MRTNALCFHKAANRRYFLITPFVMAFLAFLPMAPGVNPPPDGGYPDQNTAEGEDALFSLTTGADNTAIGFHALHDCATGYSNTALGSQALGAMTSGAYNTASGYLALSSLTNGDQNTATGAYSLVANQSGGNTAYGAFTLTANGGGEANTALGVGALYSNTEGYSNTATGLGALQNNTTGAANTGTGVNCLFYNTTGYYNTAVGDQALHDNAIGSSNTAVGFSALIENDRGNQNTAVGFEALKGNELGDNNIALGNEAGNNCTGNNNIMIGNPGVKHESGAIRIGFPGTQTMTRIAGISGVTVARGVGVIIDTNGQLGTITSSERYKDAIKPMGKASEAILSMQPVTFHYKKELDPQAIPQFGLVAEDVARVDPDLVARDEAGKPYTVRYEAVNAMLLNEFLKDHRKVEEQARINEQQETTIAEQRKQIAALAAAVKDQATQIEKVNAQLIARIPGTRLVTEE
jgi:hypothetical protein